MNVVDSPSSTAAHWLPSHVQITVHQARNLHYKNKSGHSEVYVSVQVNKDHYSTESVPKQLLPTWNQAFVIPLMSLASVIHITVRQKGRFGDSYLGYLPVNPGSYKINPTPSTHWHKLNCKPGKTSSKLRGDLQVTFQFQSKWSTQAKRGDTRNQLLHGTSMLQRSSSDAKLSGTMGRTGSEEILTDKPNQSKAKILASLRRSFRRKSKAPVFQNCDDDFASFSSQSATSTPQINRKRTSSSTVQDTNSLSSTSFLSIGMSDSDTGNSVSQTPPLGTPSKGKGVSAEGEGASEVASPEVEEGAVISAAKFQNFKSKKRPWNVQNSPSPMTSEKGLGGQEALVEETSHEDALEETLKAEPEDVEVSAFRYKSRANVLSRSFRGRDSAAAQFAARQKSGNPDMERTDYVSSSRKSGVESVVVEEAAGSMESSNSASAFASTESSRTELSVGQEEGANSKEDTVKPSAIKLHPYSRRIDLNSPTTQQRSRPKILTYGKPDMEKRKAKTGPAMLTRRSTLSAIPTGKRLLPAPPVRRGSKPALNTRVASDGKPEMGTDRRQSAEAVFAAKLASSLEGVVSEENSICDDVIGENQSRKVVTKPRSRAATRSESLSSLHSKDKQPPASPKMKHTVQYKNSAHGFQPATLLPPSLTGGTTYHSQTLPTRGKFSHGSTGSLVSDNNSRKSPSPTKQVKPDTSNPPNTRSTPQVLLNHMSPLSLPPRTPPSSSSSPKAFSEMPDGGRQDELYQSWDGNSDDHATDSASSSANKYAGKTPGEIVTSALRSRRPPGNLKKAISLYQENRKHAAQKELTHENKGQSEGKGQTTDINSARSSPLLRSSSNAGSITNLFFNSLRRTRSHVFTPAPKTRTKSAEDVSTSDQNQPDSAHTCNNFVINVSADLHNTSAPGLLMTAKRLQTKSCAAQDKEKRLEDEQAASAPEQIASTPEQIASTPEVVICVQTATESPSTVTDQAVSGANDSQRFSPNPASAAAASHVRHTTCGSVESEGFHSVTSGDEGNMEDVNPQDLSQWSKEDLVKELTTCRRKLSSTEDELKEVKAYMDSLLVRIMDTNPSLLSVSP